MAASGSEPSSEDDECRKRFRLLRELYEADEGPALGGCDVVGTTTSSLGLGMEANSSHSVQTRRILVYTWR